MEGPELICVGLIMGKIGILLSGPGMIPGLLHPSKI